MATSSTTYLQISGISVDCSRSKKNFESAEIQLGEVKRPIGRDAGAVKTLHQMKFDTPMKLSREDTFLLRLLHKKRFGKEKLTEIKFDTKEIFCACGANQEHEYYKLYDGIAIVVTVSLGLHPTMDDIFKICPRFRILVIGMSGVGKSLLINHALGVQKALVSHDIPGEANVETEFISPQNNSFVLHDSDGFQPGDKNNFKTVWEFIQRRRDMPALKDKLHAVWLCVEIPRAGGRLLHTHTEDFLRLKRDGQLGNILVVVVLTKYDIFLHHVGRTLMESALVGLSDDYVEENIRKRADAELQETCIKPLEIYAGSVIPYVAVSSKEEHKDRIIHLIQVTEDSIHESDVLLQDLTGYITKIHDHPMARGGFGEIWKCIHITDQGPVTVAVKSLLVYTSDASEVIKKKTKRVKRELRTCAKLKHPHILPVYGYTFGFGPLMAIVSPWAENGNLTVYLEREDAATLTIFRRFQILRDITAGLKYLHTKHVIHGDLTGPNVLIHADGTACLADFGLSLLYSEVMSITQASYTSSLHGNFRWLAPELLGQSDNSLPVRPSEHSDIYSFGGIMLQVLTNKSPYYYLSETAVIRCVYTGEKPERSRYPALSEKYWDFIEECWSAATQDRPSTDRVVEVISSEFVSMSTFSHDS